jgi:hypothetical protein
MASMNYTQEVDAWLTAVLVAPKEDDESDDEWLTRVKTQIKAKLLDRDF